MTTATAIILQQRIRTTKMTVKGTTINIQIINITTVKTTSSNSNSNSRSSRSSSTTEVVATMTKRELYCVRSWTMAKRVQWLLQC
jgi:hypothetical protein